MRTFLVSLFSGNENGVDSVIFAAIAALFVFLGVTIYVVIHDPSLFSPVTYSTSALTIIGAGAGGKTARDRLSGAAATPTTTPSA